MKRIISFSEEEKKIHNIILTANFFKNLGIDGGKMGVVIYLLTRCRLIPNRVYEDFAFELLEEIDHAVYECSVIGFRYGLCGIGWGFEHLVKNRFLETETDLCISFENRIWTTFQREEWDGLKGVHRLMDYLLYFLARIESSMVNVNSEQMNCNKSFIITAVDRLDELMQGNIVSQVLAEKNNDVYGAHIPLILSYWEYPLLLSILERIRTHRLNSRKIEFLLIRLIEECSLQNFFPKEKNNRILLCKVLQDLKRAELKHHSLNIQTRIHSIVSLSECYVEALKFQ